LHGLSVPCACSAWTPTQAATHEEQPQHSFSIKPQEGLLSLMAPPPAFPPAGNGD